MRFGVVIPSYGRFGDPAAVLHLVGVAEGLGYDGAWFSDHVAIPDYATGWIQPPHLEPLATCCVAMGRTTRLRFGVDVLVAAYRHPLVLATMAATADRLSSGRLTLGVGVGYLEGEFAALGVPYRQRGALTDEALTVLRHVWTESGAVSHAGGRWPFADVHVGARPSAGGIPLWVGGNARRALTRAARLGDGWHPLWPAPESYAESRQRILRLRADAGIERPFTFSMSCPRLNLLSGGASRAAAGERAAGERAAGQPARPEFGYVPPLPRDPDGRTRFTGTVDQLTSDVEAYAAAGVEHLVVRFWTSADAGDVNEVAARMAAFAEQIASRFPSPG